MECEISPVIETLYKVLFLKKFYNAKKVLNFIQSLTTEKKVIKSLTVFHMSVICILTKGISSISFALDLVSCGCHCSVLSWKSANEFAYIWSVSIWDIKRQFCRSFKEEDQEIS